MGYAVRLGGWVSLVSAITVMKIFKPAGNFDLNFSSKRLACESSQVILGNFCIRSRRLGCEGQILVLLLRIKCYAVNRKV